MIKKYGQNKIINLLAKNDFLNINSLCTNLETLNALLFKVIPLNYHSFVNVGAYDQDNVIIYVNRQEIKALIVSFAPTILYQFYQNGFEFSKIAFTIKIPSSEIKFQKKHLLDLNYTPIVNKFAKLFATNYEINSKPIVEEEFLFLED